MFEGQEISPEIILESVSAYTVQANEILKKVEQKNINSDFDICIIPPGPHYYTGILQATGYLLCEHKSNKKNIALIFDQIRKPKNILIPNTDLGPILGKTRTKFPQSKKLQEEFPEIKRTKLQKLEILDLEDQMPFLRVITDANEILPIFLGIEIPTATSKKFLNKISQNYILVFVSEFHSELPEKLCKEADQKLVERILEKKLSKYDKENFPLVNLFVEFCKSHKKDPRTIAYLNSGNFGGNTNDTTGYACLIG